MRRYRLLTLCAALWLAISPSLAVTYAVRNNIRLTRTGTAPAFASTWTCTVFENGATATANSTGTTITVATGHGFTAGDKLMVGTSTSTFRTVSSTTTTTVVVSSAVTVTSGAFILNLGADTGTATPNYDGSTVSIYQYSDGTGAYSQSRVTLDSQARYGYWVDNSLTVMELFRNSAGAPDSILFVSVAGGASSSGTFVNTCTTDRGIIVANGTGTTAGTCPTATISTAGAVSFTESTAPTTGDNPAFNVSASDTSSSATQITYPTSSQVALQPLRFVPAYRVGNDAAGVFFKGIQLDASGINTGDFDNWTGVSVDLTPNTSASSGTKYFKASTSLTLFNAGLFLDGQIGPVYPDVALFRGGATDDLGAGTSTWKATSFSTFKSDPSALAAGFWSGIATITKGYGLNVGDMPLAGANIVNWWGAYLGGPLAIEDNSAGGAAYDTRGYLAWATDDSRWLSSSVDVSGDGTADTTSAVNARFRWNDDNTRWEFDDCTTTACTNRFKLSRSGTVDTFAASTTDDDLRLSATDTTLGEVYLEIKAQAATPIVHTNLGIQSDSSTLLVNGITDIAPNDDSQTPTCTAGKLCIYDNDGTATDDWAVMNGTAPAVVNLGSTTYEGATVDASEIVVTSADPVADSTITWPAQTTGRPTVMLFSQTASTSVTGTGADQTIIGAGVGTVTIPANFFNVVGRGISFDFRGNYTSDGTPGTLTLKVLLGASTLCTSATQAPGIAQTSRGYHLTGQIATTTTGATGKVVAQAAILAQSGVGSGAPFMIDCDMTAPLAGTIDLTAAQALNIAITWSTTGETLFTSNGTVSSLW